MCVGGGGGALHPPSVPEKISHTRMHSSRMRTGRSLTVRRSLLPGEGGEWCLLLGGVCSWGGICSWGSVCSGGVCSLGGGVASQHALRQTPPPREQNDKQVQKYYLGHNLVAAGKNDGTEGGRIDFMFLAPSPGRRIRYCCSTSH